ncbi:MAG: hypothetical protein KDN22_29070 [Verrucomicrobiae bacterium]|nr:hypothetical protein [Verrucomicrobiae bacterium]
MKLLSSSLIGFIGLAVITLLVLDASADQADPEDVILSISKDSVTLGGVALNRGATTIDALENVLGKPALLEMDTLDQYVFHNHGLEAVTFAGKREVYIFTIVFLWPEPGDLAGILNPRNVFKGKINLFGEEITTNSDSAAVEDLFDSKSLPELKKRRWTRRVYFYSFPKKRLGGFQVKMHFIKSG